MAKPFKDLKKKMGPDRAKRVDARKREILREITLKELRQAMEMTQSQLAEILSVNQAAISKMENQSDMYIRTLRKVLEAMGASLRIVAEFPDGEVIIDQFSDDTPEEVGA